jgi:anti-sigma regulatory factor (Ser/Thr protein kinase)
MMELRDENPFWKEGELKAEIALRTDEESLLRLTHFVCAHAWEAGFENGRIEEIRIATYETLKNIRDRAYEGRDGEISVACSVTDAGVLIVTFTDYGRPYNMLLADISPDPEERIKKINESVRLIKRIVKNVEYRRDSFRNIIIFTILKPFT